MKKTFEKSGKIAEFGLNFGFKLAILFGLGLTFESCQTDAHLHNYYQSKYHVF